MEEINTDLALELNLQLPDKKNAQQTKGRIQILLVACSQIGIDYHFSITDVLFQGYRNYKIFFRKSDNVL